MAEKDALIEDRHAPSDKGAPIARGDDKPAVIHIPKIEQRRSNTT